MNIIPQFNSNVNCFFDIVFLLFSSSKSNQFNTFIYFIFQIVYFKKSLKSISNKRKVFGAGGASCKRARPRT